MFNSFITFIILISSATVQFVFLSLHLCSMKEMFLQKSEMFMLGENYPDPFQMHCNVALPSCFCAGFLEVRMDEFTRRNLPTFISGSLVKQNSG